MDGTAVRDEAAPIAEEARLARAAAAGDGGAFAVLYGRYEQRAFNLAYRIAGSEPEAADAVQQAFLEVMRRAPRLGDGEPSFASHLFAATRNACHQPIGGRRRPRPSEAIGESSASRGEGEAIAESTGPRGQGEVIAGSTGARGQGEPEEEAIREASLRLPEHQREALALRELEQLSYEEIGTIMETSPNSVAQLISRARINLHDELHGNVLASVVAPSPECERALPLIAMREDGQLEAASHDAAWLDAHLADCHRCEIGVEVLHEAAASYRAWVPSAYLAGADRAGAGAGRGRGEADRTEPARRRATLVAGLAALLLLAGVAAAVFAGDDPPAAPVDPAAGSAQGPSAASSGPGVSAAKAGEGKRGTSKKKAKARRTGAGSTAAETTPAAAAAGETIPAPSTVQTTAGGGVPSDSQSRPNRSSGKTAVQPTQPTSTSRPSTKPKPTAASAPAPTPAAESPPPVEESPGKSSGKSDPPGKPADRPPK